MFIGDFTGNLTTVDTEAKHTLGRLAGEVDSTLGYRIWKYVFNDGGSSFVEGSVVCLDSSTATPGDAILAPTGENPSRLLGVAQHTIASGSYGWVLVQGLGEVEAGTGGITANTPLVVDGTDAGHATDVAADTDHSFAFATEAATAGNLATCRIAIPL